MDKKSNRTDLLAAGREKLRQYRQKKDNKGKDGKGKDEKGNSRSTKKVDISGNYDTDVDKPSAVPKMKAESSILPEQEVESNLSDQGSVETMVDYSIDSSEDLENSQGLDPVLLKASSYRELEYNMQNVEGKINVDANDGVVSSVSVGLETVHDDSIACTPDSTSGAACNADAVAEPSQEADGSHDGDKEEVMQEAGRESELSMPACGGGSERPAGPNNFPDNAIIEHDVDHETVNDSRSTGTAPGTVETVTGSHQKLHREGEVVMDCYSHEKSIHLETMSDDLRCRENKDNVIRGSDEHCGKQSLFTAHDMIGSERHKSLIEDQNIYSAEKLSVCPVVQGNSVNLFILAEILKRLPDGTFRYLIKSREIVNDNNVCVPNNEVDDAPQIFQEQLYMVNILKDFLNLQLLDQDEKQTVLDHQLHVQLDQVPLLSSPLSVSEERQSLGTELSQCRSDLEVAMREKQELQNLYHMAKEDVAENSRKVDELKIKFEESRGQLSSVTGELVNYNVLFEAMQEENEKLLESLSSVTEKKNKYEEIMEQCIQENKRLSKDVTDSGAELAALQLEISNLKTSLASADTRRGKFEEENEVLVQEKEMLLGELTDCKSVMTVLQQESAFLNVNLAMVTEEHNKLKEHNALLSQEIERLSDELVVSKDKMPIHQEHVQLEADLKEAVSRLEQLTEDNIVLQSSLEIHKAKLAEIDSRHNQLSHQAVGVGTGSNGEGSPTDMDGSLKLYVKDESKSVGLSVRPDPVDSSELSQYMLGLQSDVAGLVTLKEYLVEAEKLIQRLESAINGMHSQSVILSCSGDKGSNAGVSKLIQTFESKVNIDDCEPEGPENQVSSDPYPSAQESILDLRAVLMSLTQNIEHVNALIVEEKDGRKAANFAFGELEVDIEALKGINSSLEMRNIELEVQYGVMIEHAHDIETKKIQFESLCEELKQQAAGFQSQNIELLMKLDECHSKFDRLQFQLTDVRSSSDELAGAIYNGFESLQREMIGDICAVDRQWKTTISELAPMVEKLNTVVGSAVSAPLHNEMDDDWHMFVHFASSLSSACEVIEQLKTKLEAAGKDYKVLQSSYMEANEKLLASNEEHDSAIALLQKVSGGLVDLLSVSGELIDVGEIYEEKYSTHDPLYYEGVLAKLGSLLADQLQLKESHRKLHSELVSSRKDVEELMKRCLDEDILLKLVHDVKEVLQIQDTDIGPVEVPGLVLQSSVSLLIQKYKEAEIQVNLLTNDMDSRMAEIGELHGHAELLDSLVIQHENENLVLTESLTHAKEVVDNMQAELLSKVGELEQSEQRVASVREKLSIAVAKGKGLVAQRDSLKQSLGEISGELEKYSHELQLKDSRIHEVEEKLKAYSEAGERTEALESELSYIRNSATAMRESFLLKDSSLQRIEEILEDLELPDHYHSKDIIEKVDWLAKSAAGNSLLPAAGNSLLPSDWDQRSSVGAASYSDSALVFSDGCKEDTNSTSNPIDDLGKRFDELQVKFYELAEQNDMLEQSLMERNILVQRWEEILDRINTPPQIRSMEPEERIHWLGTALSEADSHMRSLQQKVENLENYCGSLSVDLEESQRKIFKCEASQQAVLHEKERALSEADEHLKTLQQKIDSFESYSSSLSGDLEESQRSISELGSSLQKVFHAKEILTCNLVTLTSDYEIALSSIAQCEREADKSGKEINMLQGELAEKLGKEDHIRWIESEVKRLQGLILAVLQDSVKEDFSSDMNDIQYLERLIGRLMNIDRGIDCESHGPREAIEEHVSERTVEPLMVTEMEDGHVPDMPGANLCDARARSPVSEVQDILDLRRELVEALDEVARLMEEKHTCVQKNQSLASENEVLEVKIKEFHNLLNQEEQKSASLREKLNLAVRKGKSLVQQRDSLKQNIEEMTFEIEQLKSKVNTQDHSLLESRQQISNLSLEIERYKSLETENLYLKDRLMETEERSQKDGHTLNVLLSKLGEIDAGVEIDGLDPVQKLEGIAKLCSDMHATASSLEQEARKSRKAAELLLAELNEVQERNDGLQEELARTYDEISSLSKERDLADSAKVEALSHQAKLSEERKNKLAELQKLNSRVHEVMKGFYEISTLANDVFDKDIELLSIVRTPIKSCLDKIGTDPLATEDFGGLISANSEFKDLCSTNSSWDKIMSDRMDETVGCDVVGVISKHIQQLTEDISSLKDKLHSHSISLNSEFKQLTTVITSALREIVSQRASLQSIKDEYTHLESTVKEREMEAVVMRRNLFLLSEACTSSIAEIENRRARLGGDSLGPGDVRVNLATLPSLDKGDFRGFALSSYENHVKTLADGLLLAVKDIVGISIEGVEGHNKEMRSRILNLQKELQEKDIQREQICMELVRQIKEAEATAANYSQDLQSMKNYTQDLVTKSEVFEKERILLEQRVEELQLELLSSVELGDKVKALTDLVASKEQEIESLMHALDEEENQMEALRNKTNDLEKVLERKSRSLETVEASRAKALKKLSVTVSKFDELHRMSEGLLSEIENLQSQLQDRDAEISFLRQEVTRCTNDALEATKMSNDRNSSEFHELLTWLDAMFSDFLSREPRGFDDTGNDDHKCKENIQKDIMSIISELKELRVAAQRKDALLQMERNRVEELLHRKETLEVSLLEKELHFNSLHVAEDSGVGTSEIVEVEPVLNKWTAPVTSTASQVRSLRKVNNDQVSIAIDTHAGSPERFEDEDDDKVHGFKSLTTSRFVPKFTRPVSDMIDGLWVSCDRTLMRQPAFRLGIMIYWAVLHALLASFIV